MKSVLSCLWFISIVITASAQEVSVKYGGDEVALNQVFTITLTIENERLKSYSPFPEIDGFLKRGTSSSTSTSFINGKMTSSQSIIQNYQPTKEGNFSIPNFEITVNEKNYQVPGTKVTVGPAVERSQRNSDPFDFFNRRRQPSQEQEFVDVQAEAFLALTTDKKEVYVGEGFTTTLAFYVAESNRADMRFYELGKQITEIVKQIKPENCWEENFNIDNINGQPVTLNGKPYTQYKIFQAAYYPLNEESIEFESVGLKLIKYKVAKNPRFFGRNRQEDFETFYSKPKIVEVLALPPHPLKESVSVGKFDLIENISGKELKTGESFNYQFKVRGVGNISSVEAPKTPEDGQFDFYEPNIQQDIRRAQNLVTGTKAFNFYGIPNEPGTYDLGDYMQWVFFDPEKKQYDTLRSELVVNVTGESRKNEYISSSDLGSFYDQIQYEENALASIAGNGLMKIAANALIVAIILILILLRRNEIMNELHQFLQSDNIQIIKVLALLIAIPVAINTLLLLLPFNVEVPRILVLLAMSMVTVIVLARLIFKSKGYIVAGDMLFYNFIAAFLVTLINGLITSVFTQFDWSNTFIWIFIGHLLMVFGLVQSHALAHFFVRQGYSKWDAIIPFRNLYILCKITDKHFITELLLAFIPFVNVYYTYLLFSKVCQIQKIDDKHAIFATIFPFVAMSKIFYDNKENYARIYKFGYGK